MSALSPFRASNWQCLLLTLLGLCATCQHESAAYRAALQHLQATPWRYHTDAILESIPDSLRPVGEELELYQATIQRLAEQHFVFLPDSLLEVHFAEGDPLYGTYSLSPAVDQLQFDVPGMVAAPHRIGYLGADSIYLAADMKQGLAFPKILVPAG